MNKVTYESAINNELYFIKHYPNPFILFIRNDKGIIIGVLEAITSKTIIKNHTIKLLKNWREKNQSYFPSQFKVTMKGTKLWSVDQLLNKKDRILFFIKDIDSIPIGHMGLYRFDYAKKSCEIDNVIRGKASVPGIMTYALSTLIKWTLNNLLIKNIFLTVMDDNTRAVELYKRCNFKKVKNIPLKKEVSGSIINWVEIKTKKKSNAERYYQIMEYHSK